MRVLEPEADSLQKALLSLCLARLLRIRHTSPNEQIEIQAFRQLLKTFVLQWMLLDRVVEILSEEYFSGMQVLYDDTAAILKKELETAEMAST